MRTDGKSLICRGRRVIRSALLVGLALSLASTVARAGDEPASDTGNIVNCPAIIGGRIDFHIVGHDLVTNPPGWSVVEETTHMPSRSLIDNAVDAQHRMLYCIYAEHLNQPRGMMVRLRKPMPTGKTCIRATRFNGEEGERFGAHIYFECTSGRAATRPATAVNPNTLRLQSQRLKRDHGRAVRSAGQVTKQLTPAQRQQLKQVQQLVVRATRDGKYRRPLNDKWRQLLESIKRGKRPVNQDDLLRATQVDFYAQRSRRLDQRLSTIGDDAQRKSLELQKAKQEQDQLMNALASINKMMHDTARSVMRKID
jgi:hypothetical protein